MTVQRFNRRSSGGSQVDRDQVVSDMRDLVDQKSQESDYQRRKMEKAVAELRRKKTY